MAKRGTRKTRRGGAWYNPLTWFAAAPEPAPVAITENPTPAPSESPSLFGSTSSAPANPPYGGKGRKSRKTRRGGRRHSKAAKIYGH